MTEQASTGETHGHAQPPPGQEPRHAVAGAVALLLLIVAMFAWSVYLRAPWLGCVGEPLPHESVNAELNSPLGLRNVNQWLAEPGLPFWLREIIVFPNFIGAHTTVTRVREIAYTPLAWLPLYYYGKFSGRPLSMGDFEWMSMLCQLCVATALGLLAYTLSLAWVDVFAALLLAAAAAALQVFLPGPMYLYFYCYFPDIAVLPFVAWLALLEALRDRWIDANQMRWLGALNLAIAALLFVGPLVEWLMYVAAVTLVLKRVLAGEYGWRITALIRGAFFTLLPTAFAGLAFSAYVTLNSGWFEVALKFLVHTSLISGNADESQLGPVFVNQHLRWVLGDHALLPMAIVMAIAIPGLPLLALGRAVGLVRSPRLMRTLAPLFIVAAACFLDLMLLRDHHIENPHPALKFSLPYSLGLPMLAAMLLGGIFTLLPRMGPRRARAGACIVTAAACLAWLGFERSPYSAQLSKGSHRYEETARRLGPMMTEADILFAPFALGNQDWGIGPTFYPRIIYPVDQFDDWVPFLAGDRPLILAQPLEGLSPEIIQVMEALPVLGLAPSLLTPPPRACMVGFVYWKSEPCPPGIVDVIPYARRELDSPDAHMYLLDQEGVRSYYEHSYHPAPDAG